MFRHVKSGRVNFCPGELFLKLLARIGEWHQNLSEKTAVQVMANLVIFNIGGGGRGQLTDKDRVFFLRSTQMALKLS